MKPLIRPMRDEDVHDFVRVLDRAIRGLASAYYPPEVIEDWAPLLVDDVAVRRTRANSEGEIRFIAESGGEVVGIGAVIPSKSELRACFVMPKAARLGVGTALVGVIERKATELGATFLELNASLNAEPFYARLGYETLSLGEHPLRTGRLMACARMRKIL